MSSETRLILNVEFSANIKHIKISVWWSPSTQQNYCRIAMLMLKTRISRVQYARDHVVHAVICSCDGELRDHEQRPPLILGSPPRDCHELARLSVRARPFYTTWFTRTLNRFDFTGSSNVGQFGIRTGVLCATTNRKFDSHSRSLAFAEQRSAIDDKFCLSRRTGEFIKFILGVRLYSRWKL